jgi:hypothetical protein
MPPQLGAEAHAVLLLAFVREPEQRAGAERLLQEPFLAPGAGTPAMRLTNN